MTKKNNSNISPPQADDAFLMQLKRIIKNLRTDMFSKFKRHVSINDLLSDRWETAKFYGFGEGTSCYNNVLVIGEVKVGSNTWIGPNVVLDGSGGLELGSYVSVSSGVQIYTHHTVEWSTSFGKIEPSRKPTKIGDGVFIGPNSIIQMGVNIGDGAIIGAMSFVNRDVPSGSKFFGVPAKEMGS